MNFRALLRRAFPYIVIGIGGFALAYVVIFIFVLPAKVVPSAPQPYDSTSPKLSAPVDTGYSPPDVLPPIEPPAVAARIVPESAATPAPIIAPDLVGMSLPDARGVLNNLRLNTVVTRDTSSFQPPNTVISQSPPPDSLVPAGGIVTLTVSHFPPSSTADTMRVPSGAPVPPIRPADSLHPRDTTHHP
ncbi:MAG: PASTA domain-containing protein [Gemmatimonadaceae bacterium]